MNMFVEKYKVKNEKTQEYYTENDNIVVYEDKLLAEEKVKQLNEGNEENRYIVDSFIDTEEF